MTLLAFGCASSSVGVGVGVGIGVDAGSQSQPGSEIGLAEDEQGDFTEHQAEAAVKTPPNLNSVRGAQVLKTAFSQVGRPYRYGGTKPETGFDCSGFVNWVYGQYGVKLPRQSGDMMASGASVARKDLKAGDLVFFGKRKRITHVGIYTGDNKYIHSPRTGKSIEESSLDDRGRGEYYVGARRILPNPGPANIKDSQKAAWVEQAGQSMALAKATAPSAAKAESAPTPATTVAASRAADDTPKIKKYKVTAGDTFYKLARRHDIKPELLAKMNKIGNYKTAVLRPGQTLLVPADNTAKNEAPAVLTAAAAPAENAAAETPEITAPAPPAPSASAAEASDAAPPAPVRTAQARRHTIENGDTFYGVAIKYGVKAADLARANNIADFNTAVLRPGQSLVIPSGSTKSTASQTRRHKVESGDTFYGVAKKYGVKSDDLARANNIKDFKTAVLRPGQTLVVPSKAN